MISEKNILHKQILLEDGTYLRRRCKIRFFCKLTLSFPLVSEHLSCGFKCLLRRRNVLDNRGREDNITNRSPTEMFSIPRKSVYRFHRAFREHKHHKRATRPFLSSLILRLLIFAAAFKPLSSNVIPHRFGLLWSSKQETNNQDGAQIPSGSTFQTEDLPAHGSNARDIQVKKLLRKSGNDKSAATTIKFASVRFFNATFRQSAAEVQHLSGGQLALENARKAAGLSPPIDGIRTDSSLSVAAFEKFPRPSSSLSENPTVQHIHPIAGAAMAIASPTAGSAVPLRAGVTSPIPIPTSVAYYVANMSAATAYQIHHQNITLAGTNVQEESAPLTCDSDTCTQLRDKFLDTVEDDSCRAIFNNGKCPSLCSVSLSAIAANESWSVCMHSCSDDVVMGSIEQWVRLCNSHTESLIDQGKEAVKSFVSESFSSHVYVKRLLQIFVGALILFLGIQYGYRRGASSIQLAHHSRQKRRRNARKNSDSNLPL